MGQRGFGSGACGSTDPSMQGNGLVHLRSTHLGKITIHKESISGLGADKFKIQRLIAIGFGQSQSMHDAGEIQEFWIELAGIATAKCCAKHKTADAVMQEKRRR